jgi:hypothetical protein
MPRVDPTTRRSVGHWVRIKMTWWRLLREDCVASTTRMSPTGFHSRLDLKFYLVVKFLHLSQSSLSCHVHLVTCSFHVHLVTLVAMSILTYYLSKILAKDRDSVTLSYLSKILAKGRDSVMCSCYVHLVTCSFHVHCYNTCQKYFIYLYTMSYDLWISCFCFQTCRMCMKDELVDLPVLGSHQACIMHLFVMFELIMHYLWCLNLLCTICSLGSCTMHYLSCLNLLWSLYYAVCTICAHMWYYGGYIVIWCTPTVVCYCLQLLYCYLYLNCRDLSKNRIKSKKLGLCPLPCVRACTRQTCHASIVCWWPGKPGIRHSYAHGKMQLHGTRYTADSRHIAAHGNGKHTANILWKHTAKNKRQGFRCRVLFAVRKHTVNVLPVSLCCFAVYRRHVA